MFWQIANLYFCLIIYNYTMKKKLLSLAAVTVLLSGCSSNTSQSFQTDYFGIDVDSHGYITGMYNLTRESRNFSPTDQPSPLLALYDSGLKRYYYPQKARYARSRYKLEYENGSVATVRLDEKDKYFKLTLEDLTPREGIDGVQWGNYYTNINNILGDMIGVARDTSAAVCYAIGALALDDNTIGGESRYTSETGAGGYIVHTPDPEKYPLPLNLHEGESFSVGGDGFSDVAFYNRKEPFYRSLYGSTAGVDNNGRINIRYHSRDRRRENTIYTPEGVALVSEKFRYHQQRQAVPGVDYIGSSIALWGSPDSTALMDVIQTIVLEEGLPYPTFNGKWVKDPTSFMPDLQTYGNRYDSIASYAKQMGLKVINAYDQGFLVPDRANEGYLDGKDQSRKTYRFSDGNNLSHREYADLLAKDGLILGRTNITTSLAPGTKDCSPFPSDSVCVLHRHYLSEDISESDTLIYVDAPDYLNELIASDQFCPLNFVKIGKELIHFTGVSAEKPYRLLNVARGYWGTIPAVHGKGDAVDKLQATTCWGYQGLIPNLELQDEFARYYADVAGRSGLGLYDFDGQEFLFFNGMGGYSVKRFYRTMFDQAKKLNLPADIRFPGAGLSEGSWHYQSVWNVGGGKNIYDADLRVWGSTTSQGKDLRDVTYANYFPSSFGVNFPITAASTVEQYEHIEATAIGHGTTYFLKIGQDDVESCPQKYAIFNVIRTWEEARRANAFPTYIRKMLQNPALSWRLEKKADSSGWTLYQMENGQKGHSFDLKADGNVFCFVP